MAGCAIIIMSHEFGVEIEAGAELVIVVIAIAAKACCFEPPALEHTADTKS